MSKSRQNEQTSNQVKQQVKQNAAKAIVAINVMVENAILSEKNIGYYNKLKKVLNSDEVNLIEFSDAIDNIHLGLEYYSANDDAKLTDQAWGNYEKILKILGVTQDQLNALAEKIIEDQVSEKQEKAQLNTSSVNTSSSSSSNTTSRALNANTASVPQKEAPPQFWKFIDYDKPTALERAKNAAIKKFSRPLIDYTDMEKTPEGGISILGGHLNRETLNDLRKKYPNKQIVDLSILNVFELTSATGITPLTPKELEAEGVIQYLYPMLDNAGPKNRDGMHPGNILAAAKAMDEALKAGHLVYLHCKSGKGRSVMVEATYLALYSRAEPMVTMRKNNEPTYKILKAAIEYIRQKRPGIDLHEDYIANLNNDKQWEKLANPKYIDDKNKTIDPNGPYGLEDLIVKNEEKKKKGLFGKIFKGTPNIGKIILSHDAILLQKNLEASPKPADDFSYTGNHFWNHLTQRFAYRNLIMYFVLVDKRFISRSSLLEQKEAFCTLLKNDPAEAIRQLKAHFEGKPIGSDNIISKMLVAAESEQCLTLSVSVAGNQDYDIRELLSDVYREIKQYDYTHQQKLTATVQIPQGVFNSLKALKEIYNKHKDNSDKYLLLSEYINFVEMEAKNGNLANSQLIKSLMTACKAVQTYSHAVQSKDSDLTKARAQLSTTLASCGIIGELLDNSKVIGGKYVMTGVNSTQWDLMVPEILKMGQAITQEIAQAANVNQTVTTTTTIVTPPTWASTASTTTTQVATPSWHSGSLSTEKPSPRERSSHQSIFAIDPNKPVPTSSSSNRKSSGSPPPRPTTLPPNTTDITPPRSPGQKKN